MAPQYAPKYFLRFVSNALLQQYFQQRGMLADFPFWDRAETDVDDLYAAIQGPPPEQRSRVETDFQAITELACRGGQQIALQETPDLMAIFALMGGYHDRACWLFLERPELFQACLHFLQADQLSERYWIRTRDLPLAAPDLSPARLEDLRMAVQSYFLQTEGRGQSCVVEHSQRSGRHYWFAYIEDYGTADLEFSDSGMYRRVRRPAFEVVFVHTPSQGALDVYYHGPKQAIHELQHRFAFVILGLDLQLDERGRVYQLDLLKRRTFQFVYDPSWGIRDVVVKSLRLSAATGTKRHLIFSADTSHRPHAMYDFLEQVLETSAAGDPPGLSDEQRKVSLQEFHVTQAEIQVRFERMGRSGPRPRTFRLTYPNGCNLDHEGVDALLRQMLLASGLERRSDTASAA
ncbi:MAG: hypothetical protein HY689_05830 [Chloroflexi bacterium]|nr:hypothetical protein [Chloroflexota bacterium]